MSRMSPEQAIVRSLEQACFRRQRSVQARTGAGARALAMLDEQLKADAQRNHAESPVRTTYLQAKTCLAPA